eukprot:scaffold1959_cov403-Prasinococcus_capsulatus_cf.AAC.9
MSCAVTNVQVGAIHGRITLHESSTGQAEDSAVGSSAPTELQGLGLEETVRVRAYEAVSFSHWSVPGFPAVMADPSDDKKSLAKKLETKAFEALERDFEEVLQDLAGDKSLERFRIEYEKLHRALRKSSESEKRLQKKCRELNAGMPETPNASPTVRVPRARPPRHWTPAA